MTDIKKLEDEEHDDTALKDIEPGSDADEGPVPEIGKTPADPNAKSVPAKSV